MKKSAYILLMIGLMLSLQSLQAQCPLYQTYINKGNQLLQADRLTDALNAYLAAQIHCPSRAEEAQKKIKLVFDRINRQKAEIEQKKNEIEKQRDKIKEEQEKTQKAFNKIEAQKETIQKEQENTQKALNEAEASLAKAQEMQEKMEIAVFDKAVKQKIPEWKGYNNYESYERPELLTQLDSLDLSQNALVSIPKELQECPNLRHINLLGNNDIVWDSLAIIKDLPKLKSIYVSVHDLSDIEEAYWKKITGIEILKNELDKFPENILAQKQLMYLDLSRNYVLSSLPTEIGQLKNLTTLDLGFNQLSSLPNEIAELKNLTTLDLGFNQLSSLPNEIAELKNLTTLSLSENQLSSLPSEIAELKNLTTLDLGFNQLSSLPKEIGQLQNLTTLELYGNQLSSLPMEIGQLQNLTTLHPERNPIKPEEQEKIKKLLPNCDIKF